MRNKNDSSKNQAQATDGWTFFWFIGLSEWVSEFEAAVASDRFDPGERRLYVLALSLRGDGCPLAEAEAMLLEVVNRAHATILPHRTRELVEDAFSAQCPEWAAVENMMDPSFWVNNG